MCSNPQIIILCQFFELLCICLYVQLSQSFITIIKVNRLYKYLKASDSIMRHYNIISNIQKAQTPIKMWYLKQTASTVWTASKNLIDKRTPPQKLIDALAQSPQQILPTTKLNQLAAMTYQMDNFDLIVQCLTNKLRVFHYDVQKAQQTYNLLVITNYLIKHGASGFVDEFREYTGVFKKYQTLKNVKTYDEQILQKKLDYNLERIKSRANHIQVLLEDKNKLLKEKQLSMLVKQKLKLYEKQKISQMNSKSDSDRKSQSRQPQISEAASADFSAKLEGAMEKYLWRYVDKLDETIESASEKIMHQIDKYVIGEERHQFEAEQLDDQISEEKKQEPKKNQVQTKNLLDSDDNDLMKKLEEEGQPDQKNLNTNLLQFQEILSAPSNNQKKEKQEQLL